MCVGGNITQRGWGELTSEMLESEGALNRNNRVQRANPECATDGVGFLSP